MAICPRWEVWGSTRARHGRGASEGSERAVLPSDVRCVVCGGAEAGVQFKRRNRSSSEMRDN